MPGSIRLYGGVRASMPELPERMPGWCTDARQLYMGTDAGNALIAWESRPADAVAAPGPGADPEAVRAAVDFTVAAIQTTARAGTDIRYGVNFEAAIPYLVRRIGK